MALAPKVFLLGSYATKSILNRSCELRKGDRDIENRDKMETKFKEEHNLGFFLKRCKYKF